MVKEYTWQITYEVTAEGEDESESLELAKSLIHGGEWYSEQAELLDEYDPNEETVTQGNSNL